MSIIAEMMNDRNLQHLYTVIVVELVGQDVVVRAAVGDVETSMAIGRGRRRRGRLRGGEARSEAEAEARPVEVVQFVAHQATHSQQQDHATRFHYNHQK